MNRNDDELGISDDDARFVQKLDALYRPPETTALARARFTARLEERIARRRDRRSWLLAGAVASAAGALIFAWLPVGESEERMASGAVSVVTAEAPSTEETLLLLANGPLGDPDEALPDDYRTLASLLE